MAQNLQKAGKVYLRCDRITDFLQELVVFDVAPGPVDELLKAGAKGPEIRLSIILISTASCFTQGGRPGSQDCYHHASFQPTRSVCLYRRA